MARSQMSGLWDWWKKKDAGPKTPPPEIPVHVDLYEILGVSPQASTEEIRSAFRDQAFRSHPDRNPGDPVAERRYSELSQVYAILNNPEHRASYDRSRKVAPKAPPARGMIPVPGRREEEKHIEPLKPVEPRKRIPSIWENMWESPEERRQQEGSPFDVFEQRPAPPPVIPSAESPFGWAPPFAQRIPLTPGIDVPDPDQISEIVRHWPLEEIWEVVRDERQSRAFHKAQAMAVDALGGAGSQPAEWDIAELFSIPIRQVDEFVRRRSRQAFFSEILYPVFDVVTQVFDREKPQDIPGRFFLDWDKEGRVIELIYTESVGRRPWK